ncbi:MAG: hypothetical protein J0L73_04675 [Verrucomicrobia bacterium]|nr:hypothetical protein [Verrucomicrobiota bacterium]
MTYTYFPGTKIWRSRMLLGAGEVDVCGRSEHPTDEQKHLLEVFLPLLSSLTQAALEKLGVVGVACRRPPRASGFAPGCVVGVLHCRSAVIPARAAFFTPAVIRNE